MKHGFQILDADLHVIEPHDLYLKFMDPKWGDRIPRAEPRRLGVGELHDFTLADGSLARKPWREAPPKKALTATSRRIHQRKNQIAPDYTEAVERQFDPVSQIKAMDRPACHGEVSGPGRDRCGRQAQNSMGQPGSDV